MQELKSRRSSVISKFIAFIAVEFYLPQIYKHINRFCFIASAKLIVRRLSCRNNSSPFSVEYEFCIVTLAYLLHDKRYERF